MNILEKFGYCPVCGSKHFRPETEKSMRCENCGFEYFVNPSAATVAFILNDRGELLVERRKREPAKGMLDLPGGFTDSEETAEQGVAREVLEETGLEVTRAKYLFSVPNKYRYSGIDIPTLDLFFHCEVRDTTSLRAADDAAETLWLPLEEVRTEQFGLRSIRQGLTQFINSHKP